MTPNSPNGRSFPKQTSKTRASAENFKKIVMKLYNEMNGIKNNETIDELLLSDNVISGSLLEEHFIYSDQGVWKLTPKGITYADSVQMIRKSRFYMILVPAVCLISILLAVISLFY